MLFKLFAWMLTACLTACTAADPSTNSPPAAQVKNDNPVPAPPQPSAPKPDVAAKNDEVIALLEKLEKSAADLQAFTANIIYEKEDAMLERKERRTGELVYRLEPDTGRKSFALLFDSVIINNRKRSELKHYVFDGRWLAEIDHKEKQFIKREIVAPGQELDPLKLGEGPFPLPIGQPKDEVLARFEVTSATPPKEGLLKDLQNVDGLTLTPKPNTREAEDFTKVELFYDRQTMLPVGINAIEANGDVKTIRLNDVKRNPQLDQTAIKKLDIQEPDPREWRIDVRPWSSGE